MSVILFPRFLGDCSNAIVAWHTFLAVFVVVQLDGCIHRDPAITLSTQYRIGAISAKSPVSLYYIRSKEIADSQWFADVATDHSGRVKFTLCNGCGQQFEFPTRELLVAAAIKRKADLTSLAPKVDGITAFKSDKKNLIGECDDGYFIVNYELHTVNTWHNFSDWTLAVRNDTALSVSNLSNPRNPFLRDRFHGAIGVYTVFVMSIAFVSSVCLRGRKLMNRMVIQK